MTDEEWQANVAASRRAQGLPEKITDPVVIERLAALFERASVDQLVKPEDAA